MHLFTHNFELGTKIFSKRNNVNFTAVSKWKLQHVNVVTFHLELIMRHEYNHWRVVSEKDVSKELDFELVQCFLVDKKF
jgi:hypothetical protein